METQGIKEKNIKVLSISTDKNIFVPDSDVRERTKKYASVISEMHIVVFSLNKDCLKREKISENVFLYPTNSISKLFFIRDAKKISKEIIRNGNINIITTQDPFETGLVGTYLKKKFKLHLQIQIHTDFLSPFFKKVFFLNNFRSFIAKNILSKADNIRVVSDRIKMGLITEKIIGSLEKIDVLPVFVEDKNNYEKKEDFILKKIENFDHVVLMASRLSKEKNFKLALESFKIVLKKYPKTIMIIVGDGGERKLIDDFVLKNNLGNNIFIEKWSENLSFFYKIADIFLLTSFYEGYGRTLVEAYTSGCPIVSTDVGVAREVGANIALFNKESVAEKISESFNMAKKEKTNFNFFVLKESEFLGKYKKLFEKIL